MDFAAVGAALAKSDLLDKVGGDKADILNGMFGKKTPVDTATSQSAPPAEASKSVEDQYKEKADKKLKKLLNF
jgi:AsmA protein